MFIVCSETVTKAYHLFTVKIKILKLKKNNYMLDAKQVNTFGDPSLKLFVTPTPPQPSSPK